MFAEHVAMYEAEEDPSKKEQHEVALRAAISADVTVSEALSEVWELGIWLIRQLLGTNQENDMARMVLVRGVVDVLLMSSLSLVLSLTLTSGGGFCGCFCCWWGCGCGDGACDEISVLIYFYPDGGIGFYSKFYRKSFNLRCYPGFSSRYGRS